MPQQLDADMRNHLDGVLSAAHTMLESAWFIQHRQGNLPAHVLEGVEALQDDMIRLLALFEDGDLYGSVPPATTYVMRGYEADATEILEMHGKLAS